MIRFRVTPDGGEPFDVEAKARDVLVWERTAPGRAFGSMGDPLHMTDVYALSHVAARRCGLFDGSLADYETRCDIEVLADEAPEDADPTQPNR